MIIDKVRQLLAQQFGLDESELDDDANILEDYCATPMERVDVAMAIGAEGVHLGQSDMPIDIARKICGKDMIVGATAKTVEQAVEAYKGGADYLGVGAIYPTTTKVKTVLTSTETLDEICHAVPIPVNAIGGLNKDNIGVLRGINIAGICVVSAIMKADSPKKAAEELKEAAKELKIIA